MTRPTDDELEAMAARLEDGRVCSPAQNSCRNGYLMLEAAAMLRALSGTLEAEKRHKLAITGDKINAVSELRQVKAERDALKAENARLRDALSLYSCDDGCNDCPETERDRVSCGWTALRALEQGNP